MATTSKLEELLLTPAYRLTRTGRFLITELLTQHRVLSTSVRNGGQTETVRYLVNHQSCEGTDHRERHTHIIGMGLEAYHDAACAEIGLDPNEVAMMGTAANMNYAVAEQRRDQDVLVTAVVTAGVQGNAACAGDPASWRETEAGWEKAASIAGTINTQLLVNHSLTEGALARAVVTMTEAKTALLRELAVGSLYSKDLATGTGTDQFCVAAPLRSGKPLTSTSPHTKLGELIGTAVKHATREALRWQNGLEASTTRSLFHALGRYDLNEASLMTTVARLLTERDVELLKKNFNSIIFEPKVAAIAFAIAAILDRIRYGTLPASSARDIFRQQAATLAANLSAKPDHWPHFYAELREADPNQPVETICSAIALGWSAKWR
jgi:adenosylcobinamide amidohydrolase